MAPCEVPWHVCSSGALGVSSRELAATGGKMLTYTLRSSLQSVILSTEALLLSWGFIMLLVFFGLFF